MTGLGRAMPCKKVVSGRRAEPYRQQRRGGGDQAVDDHRDSQAGGSQDEPGQAADFETANFGQDIHWIAGFRSVETQGGFDDANLSLETFSVDAGTAARYGPWREAARGGDDGARCGRVPDT